MLQNAESDPTKGLEGGDLELGQPVPTSTVTASTFPFLRLPIELRKHIYRHLNPNGTIRIQIPEREQKFMRDDGEPCCPAILRLNRMIYQEAFEEWYSCAIFEVDFSADGMRYLNWVIPLSGTPPSTFRAVRYLRVSTGLTSPPASTVVPEEEHYKTSMVALAKWLSPKEKPNCLQWLHLNLILWTPHFNRTVGKPDEIRKGAVYNLNPLRTIRGLSKVQADITVPPHLGRMLRYSERYYKGVQEHTDITLEFIEEMKAEMVQMPQD
ncbi:hypothetical protein GP486_001420 [Trichoglossum hirsutum]|uniref:2EXR domain-containing protein n=1 Tax=Trichoglossum hirsutum TaxID=265104 RepID=A0A9P8LGP9_9PEZI|nr:hypothetical protein GP486_001420 [Trichoglossum hirsutum]